MTTSTAVAVNYERLSRTASGGVADGPQRLPVLMAGSIGSSLRMWDAQLPELTPHFPVIRYDHRGHGASPIPPGPYTIDALVSDTVALLDSLEVERAHLVGLSLGAMVMMRLAARHPDRVERLVVLCSTAEPAGTPQGWAERADTARSTGMAGLADVTMGRWFTDRFRRESPHVVARMRAMVTATPREGYAGCCEAIATMDLRADLGAITAPTIVIAGAQDPASPPEVMQTIDDGIRDSEFLVIDGASHLANVEQPAEVSAAILRHLLASDTDTLSTANTLSTAP